MKTFINRAGLSAAALIASFTAGCGETESPNTSGDPSAAAPAVAVVATKEVAPKIADGNTEREQGTIQVDAGQGLQALRSVATVIDAKLGEKTAARLSTGEGQKSLADATAGAPQVTESDVQAMANQFAGRTVYSSQAMHVEGIKAYIMEMDAKSSGDKAARMKVSLVVSDTDLALQRATLTYYPDARKRTHYYEKKIPASNVTLDKLERKDDKTFVVSGSFKGSDLAAGVMAKEFKGQTLASVSGRFDFAEMPIRREK